MKQKLIQRIEAVEKSKSKSKLKNDVKKVGRALRDTETDEKEPAFISSQSVVNAHDPIVWAGLA